MAVIPDSKGINPLISNKLNPILAQNLIVINMINTDSSE